MPGENIQDWSVTATNNSNADTSINWAEGQPRASVNNSARSMMAAHAKARDLQNASIVTGGSANAQTFFSGLTYTTIPTGLRVLLKIGPGLTNTGPVTLSMDGITATAVKYPAGADLASGSFTEGSYVELLYSGTDWVLLDTIPADPIAAAPPGVIVVPPPIGGTNPVVVVPATPVPVVSITNLTNAYAYYSMVCANIVPDTETAYIAMQFSTDNGATWISTPNYRSVGVAALGISGGTPAGQVYLLQPQARVSVEASIAPGSKQFLLMEIFNFGVAKAPFIMFRQSGEHLSTYGLTQFTGETTHHLSSNCNALKIYMSAGNIVEGTFTLYGHSV